MVGLNLWCLVPLSTIFLLYFAFGIKKQSHNIIKTWKSITCDFTTILNLEKTNRIFISNLQKKCHCTNDCDQLD